MPNKDNISLLGLFIILFVPFLGILWFLFDLKTKKK